MKSATNSNIKEGKTTLTQLLGEISDGKFHSGEQLAQRIGVTRTAIWKLCKTIHSQYGLKIDAVKGRGYRLANPVELLSVEHIRELSVQAGQCFNIKTLFTVDSTNRYVMELVRNSENKFHAVLAEQQTAGRGRQGRKWISPFGGNIYLSISWHFPQIPAQFSALGLAVGVTVLQALTSLGVTGLQLKWPNDLLANGKKLAGILLETHGEMSGPQTVIIGVGLNVNLPEQDSLAIDQPWTDLHKLGFAKLSRNKLVAVLLDKLFMGLQIFSDKGLQPFINQWQEFDCYLNKAVTLETSGKLVKGVARGINPDGAIIVEHDECRQHYYSGDVRLRAG